MDSAGSSVMFIPCKQPFSHCVPFSNKSSLSVEMPISDSHWKQDVLCIVIMVNNFVTKVLFLLSFPCFFFFRFLCFRLQKTLPAGRSFVAMDTKQIPQILQQIFTSTMLSSAWVRLKHSHTHTHAHKASTVALLFLKHNLGIRSCCFFKSDKIPVRRKSVIIFRGLQFVCKIWICALRG